MEDIIQSGKIINIIDNTIYIKVVRSDACSACNAKNICNMHKKKENIITIDDKQASGFIIGDNVDIYLSPSKGLKAVVYGYVFPLILLLATIITSKTLGYNDFKSGISGIIILIPYYFVLFLIRNKIKADFKFKIVRHNTNG